VVCGRVGGDSGNEKVEGWREENVEGRFFMEFGVKKNHVEWNNLSGDSIFVLTLTLFIGKHYNLIMRRSLRILLSLHSYQALRFRVPPLRYQTRPIFHKIDFIIKIM